MQAFWSRSSVVWDGAAGTFSQAVGLARALDPRRMPAIVRGPVSKGWRRRLPTALQLSYCQTKWKSPDETVLHGEGTRSQRALAERPLVLLASGRSTIGPALAWKDFRTRLGLETYAVYMLDPGHRYRRMFDLNVVPEHDGPIDGEETNVVRTVGALHKVTGDDLRAARRYWTPRLVRESDEVVISVLVGGNTPHQQFDANMARRLIFDVIDLRERINATRVLVSWSNRTPINVRDIVWTMAKEHADWYCWDGVGENPYLGLLATADALVVTADSINMVSEACSTAKPVYLGLHDFFGGKYRRLARRLFEMGAARPLDVLYDGASMLAPPHAVVDDLAVVRNRVLADLKARRL